MEFFPIALLVIIAPLAASLAAFLSGPNPIPPGVYRFGTMSHLLSFVAALALLFHMAAPGMAPISHPLLSSPWEVLSIGLSVDRLAAVMMVLIAGIGAIIHLYSIRFMGDEKGAGRFHSLLSLTIAVLLFMVSASSLLGLFLCWQLLSALLALLAYNHFHRPTARGAFRTFIMLRAGDLFFLSGLLVAYHFYRTTEFSLLFSRALTRPQTAFHDHVSHLSDGRISQGFLDIVLGQHQAGPQDGCQKAHGKDRVKCRRSVPVKGGEPVQQKTAGVDDSRMKKGMDRGRGIEGIGKPDVEGKLGRLAHGPDKNQEGHQGVCGKDERTSGH